MGKSKIIEVIELFNIYHNKIGKYQQPSKKVISINKNTTLNDLMGTLQITKETAKIIPGPLKICMERGYVALLDELNLASETVFSFLETLMTNPKSIIDPISANVINIHPEFAIICTQNPPTYEGREPLPIGIRNNAIVMSVPTYSIEECMEIIVAQFKKHNRELSYEEAAWITMSFPYQEDNGKNCFTM